MEVITRFGIDELLVVANTRHGPAGHHGARAREDGPDHDHLLDPEDARRFLADHHVAVPDDLPTDAHLRRLRALREAVRARAEHAAPAAVSIGGGLYRVDEAGHLAAADTGWEGFVDDMRLPLVVLASSPPGRYRLKRCGNRLCRWVFVDGSRNRSRRWCDMAACGNRAKVARHRAMARAG